jgi:hypothetical protein
VRDVQLRPEFSLLPPRQRPGAHVSARNTGFWWRPVRRPPSSGRLSVDRRPQMLTDPLGRSAPTGERSSSATARATGRLRRSMSG